MGNYKSHQKNNCVCPKKIYSDMATDPVFIKGRYTWEIGNDC